MRESNYRKKLDQNTWRIIIGAAAACVLGFLLFFFMYFHVDHVEIQESSHYSKEQIREMVLRGPLASNSVLAPVLYTKDVQDKPFVEGFEVSQVNRNTILVSVKEKQPVGCIKYLDCYIYFDRTGKVIESSVELDRKVPYFDGLDVKSVVTGEELPMKDTVLNTAVSLVRIFEKNELIPDHILFDEQYEITLEYADVEVKLGADSYLEDKMSRLVAILPSISSKKGILHMENVTMNSKNITFEEEREKTEEELAAEEQAKAAAVSGGEESQESTLVDPFGEAPNSSGSAAGAVQDDTTADQQQTWDGSYDDTYGQQDWTGGYDDTYGQQDWTGSYDDTYGQQDWTGSYDNTYGQQDWTGSYDDTYGQQDWTGSYDNTYGQQDWMGGYDSTYGQWGY